uniref:Uncharacterized protein n=1 Tax=Romanomermis culicivorax TaxID=13658 RepID=A0A915HJS7_ROMCU
MWGLIYKTNTFPLANLKINFKKFELALWMVFKCINNRCALNAKGIYEQLPHEKLWPCIGAVKSQEKQSVVRCENFYKH